MLRAKALVAASILAVWTGLRAPSPSYVVPIRSLGPNHRSRIARHLLSLAAQDRYLRFGCAAQDAQIQLYVDGLNFERDELFGIYDRKLTLLAVAHLAHDNLEQGCAEFGVSVLEKVRGRGFGALLFERCAMQARNRNVQTLFVHALSENAAMLKIARNAGARVRRDGVESEAYLQLPQASWNSRLTEIVQEQLARADYRLKLQAQQIRYPRHSETTGPVPPPQCQTPIPHVPAKKKTNGPFYKNWPNSSTPGRTPRTSS